MKIAEKGTPLEDCVIERMINLAQPVYRYLPITISTQKVNMINERTFVVKIQMKIIERNHTDFAVRQIISKSFTSSLKKFSTIL